MALLIAVIPFSSLTITVARFVILLITPSNNALLP